MYPDILYSELEKILIEAYKPLNYVNYGGCGWSALILCKALRKIGLKADVYFASTKTIDFLINRYGGNFSDALEQALNFNEPRLIPNRHLVVKVGDYYFDSEGMVNDDEIDPRTRIKLTQLPKVLKVACWNSHFEDCNKDLPHKKFRVQYKLFTLVESLREYALCS
jgi:hypothetical protein